MRHHHGEEWQSNHQQKKEQQRHTITTTTTTTTATTTRRRRWWRRGEEERRKKERRVRWCLGCSRVDEHIPPPRGGARPGHYRATKWGKFLKKRECADLASNTAREKITERDECIQGRTFNTYCFFLILLRQQHLKSKTNIDFFRSC